MVKENIQGAVRPMVGKVIGGIKGGARRAALGDISNASQAKVSTILYNTDCSMGLEQPLMQNQILDYRYQQFINIIYAQIAVSKISKMLKLLSLIPPKSHAKV
jgi:hypothetical protein